MRRLAAQNLAEDRPVERRLRCSSTRIRPRRSGSRRRGRWLARKALLTGYLTTSVPFISRQRVVLRQVAVELEAAGLIGAELERDGLAGAGALGDAVRVAVEAVGHVGGGEGDLDEIVLLHFDAGGGVAMIAAGDGELADLALFTGREADKRNDRDGEQASGRFMCGLPGCEPRQAVPGRGRASS